MSVYSYVHILECGNFVNLQIRLLTEAPKCDLAPRIISDIINKSRGKEKGTQKEHKLKPNERTFGGEHVFGRWPMVELAFGPL